MIRCVSPADGAAICEIYNYYIENTVISFEETPLTRPEMEDRIQKISAAYPYLVWEDEDGIVNGYSYVNRWRERSAYKFTAETSIYLRNGFQGRGMGSKLMEKLLDEVRKTDIHCLIAGIALPNDNCAALHEKFGFKKIAHFEEVGFKRGRLIDVGNWELVLSRP